MAQLDALVIAPHPDDAELGMGGAIAKMVDAGRNVGILDLTSGEPTPHGSEQTRRAESERANTQLGSPWRENLGLPNRSLEPTLAARRQVAEVIRRTRPRWLFAPYWEDAHPDHIAATQLIEAARFWAKLTKTDMDGQPHHPERVFHYYCVHLRLAIQPAFVLDISDQWDRKAAALAEYQSQFVVGREGVDPPFLERMKNEAAHWGSLIGARYGEPFTCREPIGLSSLDGLM